MTEEKRSGRSTLGLILVLIAFAAVLIFLSVDYGSTLVLIAAILLAYPIGSGLRAFWRWGKDHKLASFSIAAGVFFIGVIIVLIISGPILGDDMTEAPAEEPADTPGEATTPGASTPVRCTVIAQSNYEGLAGDPVLFSLGMDGAASTFEFDAERRGLLLKEVSFDVSDAMSGRCDSYDAAVVLEDLPRNHFYQAKRAENLRINTYLDEETVRWETGRKVQFTLIPNTFRFAKPLLNTFYGIGSLGEGLIAVIGIAFSWIVRPMIDDAITDKVKPVWDKMRGKGGV